jgi:glycosyltransferase involved in cell wall biosynthesis
MGRLKVLFLASYFPKPENPQMGTWALTQAQALVRQGIDLQVVSFTSWVPKPIALSAGAKAYANCPNHYTWPGQVKIHYPRWLYYPVAPLKQWAHTHPDLYLKLACWSAKRELERLVSQFQPDVIFCHHSLPNGWVVTQIPALNCYPLITSDYDFDEIADCSQQRQRKQALGSVVCRASTMICASNRMEQDLKQLFPQARTSTLHHAIDELPETLLKTKRPKSLDGKTLVLSCALFAERKGIPLLIEAFGRVAPKYPNAILRIIGDGSEMEKVQETIARLSLGDQVQLAGKKLHEEVLQEMVWADCFALVGWDEPFATVYLEAMAAGKPIVCCNDGGINDVFVNEVHGYAVPPRDISATAEAIDRLLGCPQDRIEMGRNAQNLVRHRLTWDAKAAELLNLFETAMANQAYYASSIL